MLKAYEKLSVEVQEKTNLLIKTDEVEVKGAIQKGDNITLDLFESNEENIAIFKIFKDKPSLVMDIYKNKDVLKSKKDARVTKKKLTTNDASLSLNLLNKQEENIFTNKNIVGGYFTSDGTKLIQLFVPKTMMSKSDFSDACKTVINALEE